MVRTLFVEAGVPVTSESSSPRVGTGSVAAEGRLAGLIIATTVVYSTAAGAEAADELEKTVRFVAVVHRSSAHSFAREAVVCHPGRQKR